MLTILQHISEMVAKKGEFTYLLDEDKVYSYTYIENTSNKLANHLLESNQFPENKRVGILMENSSELIITLLAVLKSGATFIPLDPSHPKERLSKIAAVSDLNLIICTKSHERLARSLKEECHICICSEVLKNKELSTETPETAKRIAAHDPAYVLFTSGSTGTPKGVIVSHAALSNYVTWAAGEYVSNDTNLILALFTSFAFDLTITSIFIPLITGNKLRVFKGESGQILLDEITKSDVNAIKLTPSHLKLLKASDSHIPHLKKCIVGGEDFPTQLAQWLQKSHKNEVAIFNEYGPTECTVGCLYHKYTHHDNIYDSVPIGEPINEMDYILLNDESVQTNELGEAYFKGKGVAMGYLNAPELTANSFIKMNNEQNVYYRTGDLMTKQDGKLFFKGRIDAQCQINGHRIELNEVSTALTAQVGITDAIVQAKVRNDETFLAAYILREGNNVGLTDIKKVLNQTLPSYMIPSEYHLVNSFPLTVNGKVDFKRIEALSGEIKENDDLSFLNENERKLYSLWQPLIAVNVKSSKDSFFSVGGHSLKVPILMGGIHSLFGTQLKYADIFRHSTLEAMMERISASKSNSKSVQDAHIITAENHEFYPLSQAQKRCWFAYQVNPKSIEYNTPFYLKFPGKINKEKLQNAFEKLIAIHSILRARFITKENEVVQHFPKSDGFTIELTNKSDESEILKEFIMPFKLDSEKLLRALLFRSESNSILYIDIHHSINDGTSQTIIARDLIDLYNGKEVKDQSVVYKDFSSWQKNYITSNLYSSQGEYWKDTLKKRDADLDMPIDKIRPKKKRHIGDWRSTKLDTALSNLVKDVAIKLGITEHQFIFTAFACFLNRISQQKDFVIGSIASGRNQLQIQDTIGMFANTLPIRCSIDKDKSFKEISLLISDQLIGALENQDFQFNDIVELLEVKRSLARNPLFPIAIAFQNYSVPAMEVDGSSVEYGICKIHHSHFDINLEIELKDGLLCNWQYDTDLYKSSTIDRFHKAFVNVLQQVTENSNLKISQISLIDQADKETLKGFIPSAVPTIKSSILEKFLEIVAQNPEETAIVDKQESISYRELDIASDYIRDLITTGGSRIGLIFERSAEMLACILGIWKSGSLYVPIVPELSNERMDHIISDCGINQLLIQEKLMPSFTRLEYTESIPKISKFPKHKVGITHLPTGEDLAYILYTSGSTGKPKGVMIKHNSLVNYIEWHQSVFTFKSSDSILFKTSYSFDISLVEMFWPLANGGSLVILEQGKESDIHAFYKQIIKNQISVLCMNPMFLNEFLLYLNSGVELPTQLRFIHSGGDILEPSVMHKFYETFQANNARLINSYGPTEATIGSTSFECSDMNDCYISIPIGKPIANTEVAIFNEDGMQQPIGVYGELCISGKGVMEGYVNLEEQNQLKLKQISAKKYYLSGDIARWLPDGNIEFSGRKDNQIKIRGFRIEIGDIEANIRNIDGVISSAVLQIGPQDLGAFCVLENYTDIKKVETSLREKIPNYMIPSSFMRLERLPYNSSNKIDRKKLSKMSDERYSDSVLEAPSNAIEVGVAKAYCETLGIKNIGRNSGFFELGGNSLKTMSLVVRLKKKFHVDLPISKLFENDKLSFIATEIERIKNEEESVSETAIQFNKENDATIFAFPPALGHGLIYNKIAAYLSDFKIHAFNFVETTPLIAFYVAEIQKIQAHGPYTLMGYSGGGNIAFEVTKILESKGEKVSKIIMIDSYRKRKKAQKLDVTLLKIKNELRKYIEITFSDFGKEASEVDHIIHSYYEFLNLEMNDHIGKVDAIIHLIKSPNEAFLEMKSENNELIMTDWTNASKSGYHIYTGKGDHLDMLTNHVANNAPILVEITGENED
ncbi:MAG: amino acid adenylation domain-containing protein [Crocinitomix sp.]|jgi:amino acid adenylation domain-containing protein